ncbi:hypothetical protein THOM_1508 [Trachipleistophora hominis]|uniref:Uncharacterized protein n=1 Tax=Trachipleistophora hominis TaxID=72359 RepID=L7JXQ1_TRAHO|nr:hypothetical protein THOM_1508 [Trachipleistophora hominis]
MRGYYFQQLYTKNNDYKTEDIKYDNEKISKSEEVYEKKTYLIIKQNKREKSTFGILFLYFYG